MGVFREVTIPWKGTDYVVTPSNKMLRRIEGEGISLPHMIARIGGGEPPLSEVSYVVAEFLKSAGCDVGEDDVYGEVMTALSNGQEEAFASLALAIVEAISPAAMDEKKSEAPAGKPQPKAGAKSKK